MANPSELLLSVGADTSPALRAVNDFARSVKPINLKFNSQPLGTISKDINTFRESLRAAEIRTVAFASAAGQLFAIQRAFQAITKSTIETEKSLTDINVVLGLSQKQLAQFSSGLFKVANETGASFKAAADGAVELSRQGLSAAETLKRLKDALTLTRLSGLDVEKSVNAITAAINSFNDATLDSTAIINKLASVDAQFAVSSGDLADSLSRVGSTARDTGVSFDELIGFVTAAKQITQRDGAVIGNALKTIFQRIQRPEVLDNLRELGVLTRTVNGETLGAQEILINLAKTYDTLSSAQQNQVVQLSAGVYQANQFRAILNDLSKENSIYARAVGVSSSATDQAARRQTELNKTLAASINETVNKLTQVSAKVGDLTLRPVFDTILGQIKSGADLLSGSVGESGATVGSTLGEGILKGIGNYLSGPGLLLGGALIFKLVGSFAGTAIKSLGTILETGNSRVRQEEAIRNLLGQQTGLMGEILALGGNQGEIEKRIGLAISQNNAALNQQLRVVSEIAAITSTGLAGRNLGSKPFTVKGGNITRAAVGIIPSIQESIGAIEAGYKPGKIKQLNIPRLGNVVYNDAEKVKYFPGLSQPAIIPPQNSKAGVNYKASFQNAHGFNPYKSEGLVPNFAQSITSAETSTNQVPGLFKSKRFGKQLGPRNIDIGGGKYNSGTEFLKKKFGIESRVYDPFNRSEEFNNETLRQLFGNADTATVANVLSVIKEPKARKALLEFTKNSTKKNGVSYFSIYERNRSGIGVKTSKGWQNNRKASSYEDEISAIFPHIRRRGNIIAASESPLPDANKGLVPNFAQILGQGSFGQFVDLERQSRGIKLGKKVFNLAGFEDVDPTSIQREYRISKKLSTLKNLNPLFGFPKILGSEERSYNANRIGKEVIEGTQLSSIGDRSFLGRHAKNDTFDPFFGLLQQELRQNNIDANDLRGANFVGNPKFTQIFEKIFSHQVKFPADKQEFIKLITRRPELAGQIGRSIAKKGGKLYNIDAGEFQDDNANKGLIPNYAFNIPNIELGGVLGAGAFKTVYGVKSISDKDINKSKIVAALARRHETRPDTEINEEVFRDFDSLRELNSRKIPFVPKFFGQANVTGSLPTGSISQMAGLIERNQIIGPETFNEILGNAGISADTNDEFYKYQEQLASSIGRGIGRHGLRPLIATLKNKKKITGDFKPQNLGYRNGNALDSISRGLFQSKLTGSDRILDAQIAQILDSGDLTIVDPGGIHIPPKKVPINFSNEGFTPNFAPTLNLDNYFRNLIESKNGYLSYTVDKNVDPKKAIINNIVKKLGYKGSGVGNELYPLLNKELEGQGINKVFGSLINQNRTPTSDSPIDILKSKFPQLSRGKFAKDNVLTVEGTDYNLKGGEGFNKDLKLLSRQILRQMVYPKSDGIHLESFLNKGSIPNFAGFRTSHGSKYLLNEFGQTSRTKLSAGRGQGETSPHYPVAYVSETASHQILEAMQSGGRLKMFEIGDEGYTPIRPDSSTSFAGKKIGIGVLDRKTGQFIVGGPAYTEPKIGRVPVEMSYNGDEKTSHIGHPISELFSQGLVPNYSALSSAIKRENAAGIPFNQIRVGSSPAIKSSFNPLGLGVYNTKDEPLGLNQGIQRVAAQGLDPKRAGIPNYAAPLEFEDGLSSSKLRTQSQQEFTQIQNALKSGLITFKEATTQFAALNQVTKLTPTSFKNLNQSLEAISKNIENARPGTLNSSFGSASQRYPEQLGLIRRDQSNLTRLSPAEAAKLKVGAIDINKPIYQKLLGNNVSSNLLLKSPQIQNLLSSGVSPKLLGYDPTNGFPYRVNSSQPRSVFLDENLDKKRVTNLTGSRDAEFEKRRVREQARSFRFTEYQGRGYKSGFLFPSDQQSPIQFSEQKEAEGKVRREEIKRRIEENKINRKIISEQTAKAQADLKLTQDSEDAFRKQGFFQTLNPFNKTVRENERLYGNTQAGAAYKNNFQNKAFLAGFAISPLAGIGEQAALNLGGANSTTGRGIARSIGAAGTITSSALQGAAIGATTGGAFGLPGIAVGAIGGGAIGLLTELPGIFDAFKNTLPDLQRNLEKLTNISNKTSSSFGAFVTSSQQLLEISKNGGATVGQRRAIERQRDISLNELPSSIRNKVLAARGDISKIADISEIEQTKLKQRALVVQDLTSTNEDFKKKNVGNERLVDYTVPDNNNTGQKIIRTKLEEAEKDSRFKPTSSFEIENISKIRLENYQRKLKLRELGSPIANSIFNQIDDSGQTIKSNITNEEINKLQGVKSSDDFKEVLSKIAQQRKINIDSLLENFDKLEQNYKDAIVEASKSNITTKRIQQDRDNSTEIKKKSDDYIKLFEDLNSKFLDLSNSGKNSIYIFEKNILDNLSKVLTNLEVESIKFKSDSNISLIKSGNNPFLRSSVDFQGGRRDAIDTFSAEQERARAGLSGNLAKSVRKGQLSPQLLALESIQSNLSLRGDSERAKEVFNKRKNVFDDVFSGYATTDQNFSKISLNQNLGKDDAEVIQKRISEKLKTLSLDEQISGIAENILQELNSTGKKTFEEVISDTKSPLSKRAIEIQGALNANPQIKDRLSGKRKDEVESIIDITPEILKKLRDSLREISESIGDASIEFNKNIDESVRKLSETNTIGLENFKQNIRILGEERANRILVDSSKSSLERQGVNRNFNFDIQKLISDPFQRNKIDSQKEIENFKQSQFSGLKDSGILNINTGDAFKTALDKGQKEFGGIDISKRLIDLSESRIRQEDRLKIAPTKARQENLKQIQEEESRIRNYQQLLEANEKITNEEAKQNDILKNNNILTEKELKFASNRLQILRSINQNKSADNQGSDINQVDNLTSGLQFTSAEFWDTMSQNNEKFGEDFKNTFKDAFGSAIQNGESLGKALEKSFLNFANNIAVKNVNLALDSIFGAVFDGLSKVGIGGGNKGKTGSAESSILTDLLGSLFSGKANGGLIPKYANGGFVNMGSGVKDDVPALLSGGEYVIRKSSVNKIGKNNLDRINNAKGYAGGGSFIKRFDNEFATTGDALRPDDGYLKVDPNLSSIAQTDENNPQNALKFARENYIYDKRAYDAENKKTLARYEKSQKQAAYIAFGSAVVNAGLSAYGSRGKYKTKGIDKKVPTRGLYDDNGLSSVNATTAALGGYINSNGKINGYMSGGIFGADSPMDKYPAMLMGGEYVVKKPVVDTLGSRFFDTINKTGRPPRGYADGGYVGTSVTGRTEDIPKYLTELISVSQEIRDTLGGKQSGNTATQSAGVNISVNTNITIAGNGESTQSTTVTSNQESDKKDNKQSSFTNEDAKKLSDSINAQINQALVTQSRSGGILYERFKTRA